jgi:hypothetical protein
MKRSIYLALPAILLIGWAGMRSMGVLPGLDARASETKFEKAAEPKPPSGAALICSAKSGPWSSADTWEGGSVPSAGSRVQVKEGHAEVYDVASDAAIRFLHVAGSLKFARDRDTCLVVGLVKIQAGNDASENGFDCDSHLTAPDLSRPRPALEVGTPENPIPAKHTATIRLAYEACAVQRRKGTWMPTRRVANISRTPKRKGSCYLGMSMASGRTTSIRF